MCLLSLSFEYRFIDFHSGSSPGQAIHMTQVCTCSSVIRVKTFCAALSILMLAKVFKFDSSNGFRFRAHGSSSQGTAPDPEWTFLLNNVTRYPSCPVSSQYGRRYTCNQPKKSLPWNINMKLFQSNTIWRNWITWSIVHHMCLQAFKQSKNNRQ